MSTHPTPHGDALRDVIAEIESARGKFGPMRSAHEGYAIILEELDELKAHVWTNQRRRDLAAMRREAMQVAAMAVCFMAEVCGEEAGRR